MNRPRNPHDRLQRVDVLLAAVLPKIDRRTKSGRALGEANIELRLAMVELGIPSLVVGLTRGGAQR